MAVAREIMSMGDLTMIPLFFFSFFLFFVSGLLLVGLRRVFSHLVTDGPSFLTMADDEKKNDKASELRRKMREIQANPNLTPKQKALLQQQLLRPSASSSKPESSICSKEEALKSATVSYWTDGETLGCAHYPKGCQIFAPCCGKIYPCRLCHDEGEEHKIDRYSITDMWCMHCKTAQKFAQNCINEDCPSKENDPPFQMARYFCDVCKFLDDTPEKKIYHCPDCRLCRVGEGLGETLYHCHTCCMDILVSEKSRHVCITNNSKSECPICGEVIFQSRKSITLMACGHPIHVECYSLMLDKGIIACPLCRKTVIDLEHLREDWAYLRSSIDSQPMPEEFENATVDISCNDCSKNTTTPFHFLGHQCSECGSFNTNIEKSYNFPTPE